MSSTLRTILTLALVGATPVGCGGTAATTTVDASNPSADAGTAGGDAGTPGVDAAASDASDPDAAAFDDGSASLDAPADARFESDAPPITPDAAPIGLVVALTQTPSALHLLSLDATGTLTDRAMTQGPDNPLELTRSVDGRFVYALGRTLAAYSVDATTAGLSAINATPSGLANWYGLAVDRERRWLFASDRASGLAVFPLQPDGGVGPSLGLVSASADVNDATEDPSGKFVFAPACQSDVVARYSFDPNAAAPLSLMPPVSLPGSGASRIVFHPSGKTAYVLNAKPESITSFDYEAASGTLSNPETVPYFVPGQAPLNANCTLMHIIVHPSGRFVYATNLDGGGAVAILSVATSGRLTLVGHEQYYLFRGPDPLGIDPTGTFLLVGNTAIGMQVFRIDPTDGRLTYVTSGISGVRSLQFLP